MTHQLRMQELGPARSPSRTHRSEVVGLLAASFVHGPNFCDLFPGHAGRARALPRLFAALCRDATRHGHVDTAWEPNRLVGAAVWLDPWALPRSAARQARMLPGMVATMLAAPRSVPRLLHFDQAMAALHPPQPYAYLAAIGTSADQQGQGVGSRLLARGLERADAAKVPCYLEAQRPETVAWYERHGFEVQAETRVLPGGATNWTMLRPVRTA